MSNNLQLIAVLGKKHAMSQEDSEMIFPLLEQAVKQQKEINLSFEGLEICTTIFLNKLLGRLYLTYSLDVDKYIHFSGIQDDDLVLPERLERLRKRALNPKIYQPIFDNAIGQS